jgi:hypothetical protein
LNAPSREGGDEKCLLPKAALFVVKWRHGYKERDHVHIFISFPPKYSIAKVVGILKAVSAREIRKEFPIVKKQLWGWRVLGGWILCSDGGGQSDCGSDQEIQSFS